MKYTKLINTLGPCCGPKLTPNHNNPHVQKYNEHNNNQTPICLNKWV